MIIYGISYENVVSLFRILLYVLTPPFVMMWDDEVLSDEMKWVEWPMHCDVVLGCYWPDDVSEDQRLRDHGWTG